MFAEKPGRTNIRGDHTFFYELVSDIARQGNDVFNFFVWTKLNNRFCRFKFDGATLGEKLLAPTRIYIKPLLSLLQKVNVHALAHITGGGLLENIPRVLPEKCCAELDAKSWTMPEVFKWLQQKGNVQQNEMYRTFNCGVGMVLAVSPNDVETALERLQNEGEDAFVIGKIVASDSSEQVTILD